MFKKSLVFSFVALFFLLFGVLNVSAEIAVEKIDKGSVVISELDNPAVYEFVINNDGKDDNFEIYSFVGLTFSPRGTFELNQSINRIEIKAYPSKEIRKKSGLYFLEYEIRGQNSGIYKDKLKINVIELHDVLEVLPDNIHPDETEVKAFVKNTQNTNIGNLEIEFESVFFKESLVLNFEPFEEKEISLKINKENLKDLRAGAYLMKVKIGLEGAESELEEVVNYLEKEDILVNEESSGFIVRAEKITKENVGNTNSIAQVQVRKDIISRLVTIYEPEPNSIVRSGFGVLYSWDRELEPGQELEVKVTTNYTFPFIVVILVILIVFLVKIYSVSPVRLKKKVSFVRTKGGEFALKITVKAKARKHIDNVQIIDKLPAMSKVYNKFARRPDKIDVKSRRLIWNFDKLNAGEERVVSYIIYSRLRVVGRFELPSATAVYELNGKTQESWSNKTYFVSESLHDSDIERD
jgi:hypothetical protein